MSIHIQVTPQLPFLVNLLSRSTTFETKDNNLKNVFNYLILLLIVRLQLQQNLKFNSISFVNVQFFN